MECAQEHLRYGEIQKLCANKLLLFQGSGWNNLDITLQAPFLEAIKHVSDTHFVLAQAKDGVQFSKCQEDMGHKEILVVPYGDEYAGLAECLKRLTCEMSGRGRAVGMVRRGQLYGSPAAQ